MKHNHFVKSIALSALMASAIAMPAAANAESGSQKDSLQTAPLTISLSAAGTMNAVSAAAVQLPDPLKLAEEYAPDTVHDWEQTLEKHASLAGEFTISTLAEGEPSLVPPGDAPVQLTRTLLSSAETAEMFPGQEIEGIGNIRFSLTAKPAETGAEAAAGFVRNLSLAKDVGAEGLTVSFSASNGQTGQDDGSLSIAAGGSLIAITAAPGDDSLLQGRIALHEAVQSKDGEAVRKSLAELLKLYKAQIEKLEQAAE